MKPSEEFLTSLKHANDVASLCNLNDNFWYRVIVNIHTPGGLDLTFNSERDARQYLEDQIDWMSFQEACRRLNLGQASVQSHEFDESIRYEQVSILKAAGYEVKL